MEQQATLDANEGLIQQQLRLRNFPISFFALILGLTGTTIAFQRAEMILKLPIHISLYILIVTVALFVIILTTYTVKLIKFPDEVKKELAHPVRLSFFPTISISFLLLSIASMSLSHTVSKYLWILGTILHALFTLYVISEWIQHSKFQMGHFNAAWFIPVVGNIIIPVAGAEHGFIEISWLFFSIGFVFWVVLMAILFNRLIFHSPLPEKLIPTLFIMIAPPAVGFIAYVKVNHEHMDNFATILYYFALFLFMLLVFQYKMFARIKFFLSWWAYSFPIAAMTIATTFRVKLIREEIAELGAASHFTQQHVAFHSTLAFGLLGLLSVAIVVLFYKTIMAMRAQEICVPEE